jgi:hypothetical protein
VGVVKVARVLAGIKSRGRNSLTCDATGGCSPAAGNVSRPLGALERRYGSGRFCRR